MKINHVKHALAAGEVQLGTGFAQLRSEDVVRILAAAGFQWAFLDAEHGGFGIETLQDLCRFASTCGLAPIVRVADLQYALVARALDCGAQGVIFPRVESPELLAKAVSWARFPPLGIRGFGLTGLHADFEPVTIAQMVDHINANTMVVLQIETRTAVERANELLSVGGLDAVMIGPVDLSISLGVAGEFDHPRMVEAIERVREACNRHGVAPGIQTRNLALARFWKERGMRFLGCSNETAMLYERAKSVVEELRRN